MKESTAAVAKAKDTHNARLQEVEKARKDNSAKEIEKSEAKLRKHQDDYKALVEKHNIIKQEFEKKMTITCRVSVNAIKASSFASDSFKPGARTTETLAWSGLEHCVQMRCYEHSNHTRTKLIV